MKLADSWIIIWMLTKCDILDVTFFASLHRYGCPMELWGPFNLGDHNVIEYSPLLHRYGYPMDTNSWGHFNLVDHTWIHLGMSCPPSSSSTSCSNHIWYFLLFYFVCVWHILLSFLHASLLSDKTIKEKYFKTRIHCIFISPKCQFFRQEYQKAKV